VSFYDVLAEGYHTPLTRTQIADLFHAGRLARDYPCKEVEKKEWRTIDELFPLLKYDAALPFVDKSAARPNSQAPYRALAVAISALLLSAATLALYFGLEGEPDTSRDWSSMKPASSSPARFTPSSPSVNGAVVTTNTSAGVPKLDALSQQSELVQERLNAAQKEREQSQAVRLAQERANAEQRERERQKAAGKTVRIPLDQFTIVPNVGGSNVTVKIHDHDITAIDVWTPSGGPVRMTKQKGISNSRTDETLIYWNGRAQLYYVWEISGNLNHCLLRVRDE
jgi:hypothetical protein